MTVTMPRNARYSRDDEGVIWIEWNCCPGVDHVSKSTLTNWLGNNCPAGTEAFLVEAGAGEILSVNLKVPEPVTGRRFRLVRYEDMSNVSGVGVVAHGVQFPDGNVALRWSVPDLPPSTAVWDDIEAIELVHGHQGKTVVEWVD